MSEHGEGFGAVGRSVAPEAPRVLRAGDLRVRVVEGSVREITWAGREAIGRIYVGVRTEGWETIPGIVQSLFVDQVGEESFSAHIACRHLDPGVEVIWEGTLEGSRTGQLSFSMVARVLKTAKFDRIGLCVLHRSRLLVGGRLVVHGIDRIHELVVSPDVAPQKMVGGFEIGMTEPFHTVEIATASGLIFEERYDGASFEMEDERNFGDGFFKVYGPPLRDGYPVERKQGSVIKQSIAVAFRGNQTGRSRISVGRARTRRDLAELHIGLGTGVMPPVGIDRRAFGPGPVGSGAGELLRRPTFAHVRCDIGLTEGDWPNAFADALGIAAAYDAPLECAITVRGAPDEPLAEFAALAAPSISQIARVLLYSGDSSVPSPLLMTRASRAFRQALPGVALFAACGGDFADVNTARPSYGNEVGVAFSTNPGVHLRDDEIAFEGLFGQFDAVASTGSWCGSAPAVTPISLGQMGTADGNEGLPIGHVSRQLLAPDDVRLESSIGAAWLAGSIAALVTAGSGPLTYATRIGDDHPRPFVQVIGAACRMRGAPLLRCRSQREELVRAFGVLRDSHLDLIVVNVGSSATVIEVSLPDDAVAMNGYVLDDETLKRATVAPAAWRDSDENVPVRAGHVTVRLASHGVGFYRVDRERTLR